MIQPNSDSTKPLTMNDTAKDAEIQRLARQLEVVQAEHKRLQTRLIDFRHAHVIELERQLAEAQQENMGLHGACARHTVENNKLNDLLQEAQQKVQAQAARLAHLMWGDCREEGYVGPRGANHCAFEGTHVCWQCNYADAQQRIAELEHRATVTQKRMDDSMRMISMQSGALAETNLRAEQAEARIEELETMTAGAKELQLFTDNRLMKAQLAAARQRITELEARSMESNQTACACLHVEYKPIHNLGGTQSEQWCCRDCKTVFVIMFWLKQAEARLAAVQEEFENVADSLLATVTERDRLGERLTEVVAALESLVWDGDTVGRWCYFCKVAYPHHQTECKAEAALLTAQGERK